jgi:hypothetical protein
VSFTVYHESAEYWDIGEIVEPTPAWAEGHMGPGDRAVRRICRVPKISGAANLNLLLTADKLLAALRAATECLVVAVKANVHIRGFDPETHHIVKLCRAAIADAKRRES